MQRGATPIQNMLNKIRIECDSVGNCGIGFFGVPFGRPTGFRDKHDDIRDVEVPHGEVRSVDHGVEEFGVVKKSVGINHLFRSGKGLEKRVIERDEVFVLHEDVVGVEVEH